MAYTRHQARRALAGLARTTNPTTSHSTRPICQHLVRPSARPSTKLPLRLALGPQQSVRWHSVPSTESRLYDFAGVKEISSKPSTERVLIDVREPAEFEAGYIPTAINLPIKSQPDAIFLPEDEFEDRFGFAKPGRDQEVVFYCKSGVRSSAAAQLARQHGYTNVAEYRGSWLDWTKNGGQAAKP